MSRTQVAIVGAGPAGLLLAAGLAQRGIDTVVLEARSRAHCEQRQRAGILEQGTVDLLEELGAAARLHAEGFAHDGLCLVGEGQAVRIDLHGLTGRRVALWPQTEVVKDLIAARTAAGMALHFEVSHVDVRDVDTDRPSVGFTHPDGRREELACDVVAGCDGFHGVCRAAIPERERSVAARDYPFAWLGILASVAPSCEELIYASSEHGFALHSMRTAEVSRLYVQVDPGDALQAWPDERIWEQLHLRLAHPGFTLQEGPVTEKAILPMRSWVSTPMRHGRLVLAGDAAHIVPPTGAKGLNLAAADVRMLTGVLERFFGGEHEALGEYSERALARVWRAEHFSWWMTTMLHRDPEADAFARELQRSQLRYVLTSQAAQTMLAENYTGLPL